MLFNNNKAMQKFYQKRRTSRRIAVDIEQILSCSLWSYREMGLLLLDPQALPLLIGEIYLILMFSLLIFVVTLQLQIYWHVALRANKL